MNSHPDYELEVVHHMQNAIRSEVGRFRVASASAPVPGIRGRFDRALGFFGQGRAGSERVRLAENK